MDAIPYECNVYRWSRAVFHRNRLDLDHQVGMRQTAQFDSRVRR